MSDHKLIIPKGYKSSLDIVDTEVAIKLIKDTFERELADALNLTRVSAPLFVLPETGLNDNLNGVERPVQFDVLDLKKDVQIIQSLAKWKRYALHKYNMGNGSGLYTDMNAIRRDETLDNLHSIYVDQWDWERVIHQYDRNLELLEAVVKKIIDALLSTQEELLDYFPSLERVLTTGCKFLTTQELEDMYPEMEPFERENAVTKEFGTVFLMQIGGKLKSGKPHDGRSPDYDDWSLNGDILIWNPVLERVFEISSMGVRVDAETLDKQLALSGCDDRRELTYHKMILSGELPQTVGGGIGQSRICMLLLKKAHIGEVQASVWPQDMVLQCESNGIHLL